MPASQPRRAMARGRSHRTGERLEAVGPVVLVLTALLLVALIGAAISLPTARDRITTAWRDGGPGIGAGLLEAGDGTVDAGTDSVGQPAPEVVDYTRITGLPDGVVIRTPDSVDALSGAPQGFRDYLAGRLSQVDPASECPRLIGVQLIRADGYAVGILRGCGDVPVAWVKVNGVWKTVASGAAGLDCSVLANQKVPPAMADLDCPPARSALVTFRQAPTQEPAEAPAGVPRVGSPPRSVIASEEPSATPVGPTADDATVPPPAPTPDATSQAVPSPLPSATETPDAVAVLPAGQLDEDGKNGGSGKSDSVCRPTKGDKGETSAGNGQARGVPGPCPEGARGAAQQTRP